MKVITYVNVGIPMEVNDKYNVLRADWFKKFPDKEYDPLINELCNDLDKAIIPLLKENWILDEYSAVKVDDNTKDYLFNV